MMLLTIRSGPLRCLHVAHPLSFHRSFRTPPAPLAYSRSNSGRAFEPQDVPRLRLGNHNIHIIAIFQKNRISRFA